MPVTACTHTNGCSNPWYAEGLCSAHYKAWKASGGPNPALVPTRYEIVRDGVVFHVMDAKVGRAARLAGLVCWALDVDAALDAFSELREDEWWENAA